MIRLTDEQRLRETIEELERAHEDLHRTTWRHRIILAVAVVVVGILGMLALLSYP